MPTIRSSVSQRLFQLVAVGHRQHRVARADEQRLDLAESRVVISLAITPAGSDISTDGKPPIRDRLRV